MSNLGESAETIAASSPFTVDRSEQLVRMTKFDFKSIAPSDDTQELIDFGGPDVVRPIAEVVEVKTLPVVDVPKEELKEEPKTAPEPETKKTESSLSLW